MTLFILALVFASVVALVLGLGAVLLKNRPVQRRLSKPVVEASGSSLLRDRLVEGADGHSALRRRLLAAGLSSASAPATFRTIRVLVAVGAGVVSLAVISALSVELVLAQRLIMAMAMAGLGWLLPPIYLDRMADRRRDTMRVGFPDSLDLMQVCVEAGLGLDAAIAQIAEEIGKAHPLLGEQYRLLGQELRAGRNRDDALRALAERLDLDEAKAFATMLIQSDSLGTSVADALRTYAEDMRGRRMLAAEEKAQQLGVKLSLPLVGLILPALLVVIVTPAAQKIARLMWPLINR